MTLKSRMILFAVLAAIFTAGFFVLLAYAFVKEFSNIFITLSLLLSMMAAMFMWGAFYLTQAKIKDSLLPKRKYFKKGNRAASRRKGR